MSALEVYLILMLDNFQNIFATIAVAAFAVGVIILHASSDNDAVLNDERAVKTKKWCKITFITFFLSAACAILIPSTKMAAAMYIIPSVTNNVELSKLPANVVALLNRVMEEGKND